MCSCTTKLCESWTRRGGVIRVLCRSSSRKRIIINPNPEQMQLRASLYCLNDDYGIVPNTHHNFSAIK